MDKVEILLSDTVERFSACRQPVKAAPMRAYMKDQFAFLGITQPQRKVLLKPIVSASKQLDCDVLLKLITKLYALEEREFQYAAIDLLTENIKRFPADWDRIKPYVALVDEKAWWDSVDALRKPISIWTLRHQPQMLLLMMNYLLASDSLWLRRVAITLQLQWKQQTDKVWLTKAIEANQWDHQFFIQKAIGWALREFSKIDPEWVTDFLLKHQEQLSVLAVKEASKYLHIQ